MFLDNDFFVVESNDYKKIKLKYMIANLANCWSLHESFNNLADWLKQIYQKGKS